MYICNVTTKKKCVSIWRASTQFDVPTGLCGSGYTEVPPPIDENWEFALKGTVAHWEDAHRAGTKEMRGFVL